MVRAKVVEHVFADGKERRSLLRCRYVGLKKNTLHFTLLAINAFRTAHYRS